MLLYLLDLLSLDDRVVATDLFLTLLPEVKRTFMRVRITVEAAENLSAVALKPCRPDRIHHMRTERWGQKKGFHQLKRIV